MTVLLEYLGSFYSVFFSLPEVCNHQINNASPIHKAVFHKKLTLQACLNPGNFSQINTPNPMDIN